MEQKLPSCSETFHLAFARKTMRPAHNLHLKSLPAMSGASGDVHFSAACKTKKFKKIEFIANKIVNSQYQCNVFPDLQVRRKNAIIVCKTSIRFYSRSRSRLII